MFVSVSVTAPLYDGVSEELFLNDYHIYAYRVHILTQMLSHVTETYMR